MTSPIAIALVVLASMQGPTGGVVRGQVRSLNSGAPLRYAVIEVMGGGATLVAPTDSSGIYVLRNVPTGAQTLRATHIDHATHEVEIFIGDGKEVALDFDLELRPVRLPPITTRGVSLRVNRDTVPAGNAALGPATVRVLESTPGVVEMGLAEMAKVPGNEQPDPSDILYVRGGAADLKLVLLDGAPVYAPFHLGGLINPLDPDVLHGVTLYLGGAPARYDGGISYVMDLETRAGRGNRDHAALAVDLLSARTSVEGPIVGGVTYLASGRAVHGLGAEPFIGGTGSFPYLYGDALGRIDIDLDRYGRITTTGFWNRESVRLDSLSGYRSEAVWGNGAGSVRYRGQLGASNAEITVGVGNFHTQLPVGGLRPLLTDGIARRVRVGINLERPVGGAQLHYGLQFDRLKYEYRAWPRPRTVNDDSLLLRAEGAGQVAGAYVDAAWQVASKLQLRGGLRADVFSLDPTPRFAPRAAATFLLNERASLTLAVGQYRQYVRASGQTLTQIGTEPPPDSARRPPLNVASASHVVLTLDQDLGEGIRLGLESFYKSFDGLPMPEGERAESSGLDLWVRRSTGRLTGWLGYSLAWIWSEDEVTNRRDFAGRHLISAGLGGPITYLGRFDLRVAYGAGLPYTAIPEPETPPVFTSASRTISASFNAAEQIPVGPNAPNEPYIRVDLQVARTFLADLRGFAFELTPYFKVLNALDRRDAMFYHFDRNAEAPDTRALAPLPILPILGFEWKF